MRKIGLSALLVWMLLLPAARPAAADDIAVTVTKVVMPGNIEVIYTNPATRKPVKTNVTVPANPNGTPADTPAQVAQKIAAAIPGAAIDPKNPMRVIVPAILKPRGDPNGVIEQTVELLKPPAPPPPPANQPSAMLFFDPGLNGETTLAVDSTVTAGYLGGAGLATYDASAGQTIAQLTAGLDNALMSHGYLVSDDLGVGEVTVDWLGAGTPFDLLFSLIPLGAGDPVVFADVAPVPEPAAWQMLPPALLALGWLARRRPWAGRRTA